MIIENSFDEQETTLLLGTWHIKTYDGHPISIKDIITTVVDKKIETSKVKRRFTITNLNYGRDFDIAGELIEYVTGKDKKKFKRECWKVEKKTDDGEDVVSSSRFVFKDHYIIFEEKSTLDHDLFLTQLKTLCINAMHTLCQFQIALLVDNVEIDTFLQKYPRLKSIDVQDVILLNPFNNPSKISKAIQMIKEVKSEKISLRNNKDGLNKDSDLITGFFGLAEEGQINVILKGCDDDNHKAVFISTEKTIKRKIIMSSELSEFIPSALEFLTQKKM